MLIQTERKKNEKTMLFFFWYVYLWYILSSHRAESFAVCFAFAVVVCSSDIKNIINYMCTHLNTHTANVLDNAKKKILKKILGGANNNGMPKQSRPRCSLYINKEYFLKWASTRKIAIWYDDGFAFSFSLSLLFSSDFLKSE